MRSAITPPKVNRFGWNLEHSEHIVRAWPWQILGEIRPVATAREHGKILFFLSGNQCTISSIFCQQNSMKFEHITWIMSAGTGVSLIMYMDLKVNLRLNYEWQWSSWLWLLLRLACLPARAFRPPLLSRKLFALFRARKTLWLSMIF